MSHPAVADIGLIGLAVMGQNLALNIADHGFKCRRLQPHDGDDEEVRRARTKHAGRTRRCETRAGPRRGHQEAAQVHHPRQGRAGRRCGVESCSTPGVEQRRHRRRRRQRALDRHHPPREATTPTSCKFFGSGVSGGEEGARFGPSLMPGGDPDSWKHLEPIWEAVARQGRRQDRQAARRLRARASPSPGGVPCTTYIGAQRRGPLREDGPQRHRVQRHADDLRGLHAACRTCSA